MTPRTRHRLVLWGMLGAVLLLLGAAGYAWAQSTQSIQVTSGAALTIGSAIVSITAYIVTAKLTAKGAATELAAMEVRLTKSLAGVETELRRVAGLVDRHDQQLNGIGGRGGIVEAVEGKICRDDFDQLIRPVEEKASHADRVAHDARNIAQQVVSRTELIAKDVEAVGQKAEGTHQIAIKAIDALGRERGSSR